MLVPTNHHKTCAQSHYNDPHTNLSLRKQRKPLVVGLVLTSHRQPPRPRWSRVFYISALYIPVRATSWKSLNKCGRVATVLAAGNASLSLRKELHNSKHRGCDAWLRKENKKKKSFIFFHKKLHFPFTDSFLDAWFFIWGWGSLGLSHYFYYSTIFLCFFLFHIITT